MINRFTAASRGATFVVVGSLLSAVASAQQVQPPERNREPCSAYGARLTSPVQLGVTPGPLCPTVRHVTEVPSAVWRNSGGSAFLTELVGGTLGSAAGVGAGLVVATTSECSNEDLECTLRQVGVALGLGVAGSSAGTWLAGRIGGTRPSAAGAVLGALAGVPAGLGFVHLLSEDLDVVRADAVLFASYALAQGFVTALGSRLLAALRD